jgi:hypothetical protein
MPAFSNKQIRRLLIWCPLVTCIFILLPTLLLWRHPQFPTNATPAQTKQYFRDSDQDSGLMEIVCSAIIFLPALGAVLGSNLLAKRPAEEEPTEKITIQIDAKWQRIVQSPVMVIVASLTGVSCSFCPLFLYWCGKGTMFKGQEYFLVPICFVVIYGVSFFYIALGGAVIAELRKKSNAPSRYVDR